MDNYNKSCDYKKERNSQRSNNKGKKMPVIVVSKKNKYKSSAYNYFHKKHQIIKIQSAWRGYFLRKIAVGSIKKYIGFIALIKYLDKIYYNNIQYLFEELIFFLKNKKKKYKYIYRKINNRGNSNSSGYRYRNKKRNIALYTEDNFYKNDYYNDNDDILGYRAIKNTMFKSVDYEPVRDKSENYSYNRRYRQTSSRKRNLGINNSFASNEMEDEKKKISRNKKTNLDFRNNTGTSDDIS